MRNSERKVNKITYTPPMLICENIELEGSIAASSATVVPGGRNDFFAPDVEAWQSEVFENDILF